MNFKKKRLKLITDENLMIYDFIKKHPVQEVLKKIVTPSLLIEFIRRQTPSCTKNARNIIIENYKQYNFYHYLDEKEQKEKIIEDCENMIKWIESNKLR